MRSGTAWRCVYQMLTMAIVVGMTFGMAWNAHCAVPPVIAKAVWTASQSSLQISGQAWKKGESVVISEPATGNILGTVQADKLGRWTLTVTNPTSVPCRVWAKSVQGFAEKSVQNAPALCNSAPSVKVFSFNNLGMHCYDSDFSVFSILPPFNTVNAQIVRMGVSGTNPLILDPTRATLFYRAVADKSGSMNTTSVNKTNFWDNSSRLFGVTLPPDQGLVGAKMPGAGNVPQSFLSFDPAMKWFTAEGIPITNWDDRKRRNPYPLMGIQPFDVSTVVVPAQTYTVLPVSDEMHCSDCHDRNGMAANKVTQKKYGIPAWSTSTNTQIRYRENILILHSARHSPNLIGQKPVLCAACHYSPALDLAGTGPKGDQIGKPMLSYVVHGRHGKTVSGNIPGPNNPPIIPGTDVATCYKCHPGSATKCLRGAMGSAGISCNDCHGGLLAVGGVYSKRVPWVNEPKCQSCHTGDALDHLGSNIRSRIAYSNTDPAAIPIVATNKRFAEENEKLYRNSVGHGGIACQACHGSTHAEWPVGDAQANDNVAAVQLQGHTGPVTECTTCHTGGPALTTNGPHGLHNVNSPQWNEDHHRFFESNPVNCKACHGATLQGTVLSRAAADRNLFADEHRPKFIAKGTQISCMLCHENPQAGKKALSYPVGCTGSENRCLLSSPQR
jgi:hypothetical protein